MIRNIIEAVGVGALSGAFVYPPIGASFGFDDLSAKRAALIATTIGVLGAIVWFIKIERLCCS